MTQRFAIPALCLSMLAACASAPWQKAGADRSAVDTDIRQCQLQANVEARKLADSGINEKPVVGVTPRGQASVMRLPQGAASIDPVAEDNLFRACMRDKGYSRDPAR